MTINISGLLFITLVKLNCKDIFVVQTILDIFVNVAMFNFVASVQ